MQQEKVNLNIMTDRIERLIGGFKKNKTNKHTKKLKSEANEGGLSYLKMGRQVVGFAPDGAAVGSFSQSFTW